MPIKVTLADGMTQGHSFHHALRAQGTGPGETNGGWEDVTKKAIRAIGPPQQLLSGAERTSSRTVKVRAKDRWWYPTHLQDGADTIEEQEDQRSSTTIFSKQAILTMLETTEAMAESLKKESVLCPYLVDARSTKLEEPN